jgi:hypothetical protein
MIFLCPKGHASTTPDYCDQCGDPIAASPAQPTQVLPVVEEADTSQAARLNPCPRCRSPRSGDDRFCEACGYDFLSPTPAAVAWEAVVRVDTGQFARLSDRFASAPASFPTDHVEQRFALDGLRVRIGRSQGSRPETAPEIALHDPGVSREHAILERQRDGTYAVLDLESTNGTTVNDGPVPVRTDKAPVDPLPLDDGDQIRLGAWTTITIRIR